MTTQVGLSNVVLEEVGCDLCGNKTKDILFESPDRWHGNAGTFGWFNAVNVGLFL